MATQKRTQASRTASRKTTKKSTGIGQFKIEITAIVFIFIGILLLLGFFQVEGFMVSFLCDFAKGLWGVGYFLLPFALFWAGVVLLKRRNNPFIFQVICIFALPVLFGGLCHVFTNQAAISWGMDMVPALYRGGVTLTTGGVVGGFFTMLFSAVFSDIGAFVVLLLLFFIALAGAFSMSVISILHAVQNRPRSPKVEPKEDRATVIVNKMANKHIERVERKQQRKASQFDLPVDDPIPEKKPPRKEKKESEALEAPQEKIPELPGVTVPFVEVSLPAPEPKPAPAVVELPPSQPKPVEVPVVVPEKPVAQIIEFPPLEKPKEPEKVTAKEAKASAEEITHEIEMAVPANDTYLHPPTSLLKEAKGGAVDGTEEMRLNSDRLNATLSSFHIDARIVNVTRGPSVTRYELELDRGVKLSKLTNLADDIALALGASGVRISAIPDKISVVGIEVPNRHVTMVSARDVLDSQEFRGSNSKVSFAIGKDIGGNRIIGDIARLPHLLIAGTTGSGKSVCMNSLIISLLFKAKPDEVRLIMVDPKMVELGIYNGIPHLLIPVVTDPKKAAGALQWAVTEMLRRYRMMADSGVRDMATYNKQVAMADDERKPMEQIVVVIDELADLMLVAAKEVEESICRIAQMGRASGIHLVIATQRPSADVITGLMKANIPSRIAFAVASAMESRIILDTQGAEKLVGKGDMLYAPLGQGKPKRVQGCFITDEEVQEVVEFIKTTCTPNYSQEVQEQIELSAEKTGKSDGQGGPAATNTDDGDELLPAAVEVLLETGQGSVSMLQRRLKLGYARAARIMDEMEEKGYVGPFEGSKPRQLLVTRDQWEQLKGGTPQSEPADDPALSMEDTE